MFFKKKTNEDKLRELEEMRNKRMQYSADLEIDRMHREERNKLKAMKAESSTFRRVAKGVGSDLKSFADKHVEFNPQGQQGSMFGKNNMFGQQKKRKL